MPSLSTWARRAWGVVAGTAAVNALILAIGVTTGVISARYFGPSERGQFLAVLLWSGVLANFSLMGLEQALIYASRGSLSLGLANARALRGRVVTQASVGFLVATCVNLVLLRSAAPHFMLMAVIGASVVPMNAATQLRLSPLLGGGRRMLWNLIRMASPVAYFLALGILALTGNLTVTSGLAAAAVGSAASFVLSHAVSPHASIEVEVNSAALAKYGRGTVLVSVSYQLAAQLDTLVLGVMGAGAALGIYAVAVSLTSASEIIKLTAEQLLFPRFVARGWRRQQVRLWAIVATVASGLAATALLPFAGAIISLVYGSAYTSAVEPLVFLLAAAAIRLGTAILGAAVRASGDLKILVQAQIFGIAVSTICMALLMPSQGSVGAAIAVLGAQVTGGAFILAKLPAEHKVPDVAFGGGSRMTSS